MDRTGPPDDAYGRVTDAARYEVLVETAERVIEALDAAHQITIRRGGAELDPDLCNGLPVDRFVQLEPAQAEAAPITIVLTTFPGVAVRAGRWRTTVYPSCGCDACDERPDDLAEDLERELRAVAAGRLFEDLQGGIRPHLTISLSDDRGPLGTQRGPVSRGDMKQRGGPARHDWQPWPPRSS